MNDGREPVSLLLGHVGMEGAAVVRCAGGPEPAAVRAPTLSLRDLAHGQHLAGVAFALDGSIWPGDWHTHPRHAPVPSTRDLSNYQQLLEDPELDAAVVLGAIVGVGGEARGRPSLGSHGGRRHVPLLAATDLPDNDLAPESAGRTGIA